MSKLAAISILFLAAALEAGDALIRNAIRAPGWSVRLVFGFTAALVLLAAMGTA